MNNMNSKNRLLTEQYGDSIIKTQFTQSQRLQQYDNVIVTQSIIVRWVGGGASSS